MEDRANAEFSKAAKWRSAAWRTRVVAHACDDVVYGRRLGDFVNVRSWGHTLRMMIVGIDEDSDTDISYVGVYEHETDNPNARFYPFDDDNVEQAHTDIPS